MQAECSIDKKAKLALLLICLVFALPVIAAWWTDYEARSKFERRPLSPFIKPAEAESLRAFFAAADEFIDDHIGFALQFNRIFRQLKLTVFGDSPMPNVVLGPDGLTFLTAHIAANRFRRIERTCRDHSREARGASELLIGLNQAAKARGLELLVAMVPSKLALYPDRLPENVPALLRAACKDRVPAKLLGEQLRPHLENAGVRYVYPLEELKMLRDEVAFYPPENFHAAGMSGNAFARAALAATGITVGEMFSAGAKLVQVNHDLRILGFNREIVQWHFPYDAYDLETLRREPRWIETLFPNVRQYRTVQSNSPVTERVALVLSNSFGDYLARDLAPAFRVLTQVNMNNMTSDEITAHALLLIEKSGATDLILVAQDGFLPWPKLEALVAKLETMESEPAAQR